jgi:Flp pilus assembly protein TadD
MLARALDACDQFHEALVESETAASLSGDSQPYAAHLGYAHARNGDHTEARRVLSRLAELSKHKYISPYDFAVIYAALGDKDHAFMWLEQAYEQRTPRLTEITDPGFKTLKRDPRFRALAGRIGLP